MSGKLIVLCTYCQTPSTKADILVAAPNNMAAICDECVELAVKVIKTTRDARVKAKKKVKPNEKRK